MPPSSVNVFLSTVNVALVLSVTSVTVRVLVSEVVNASKLPPDVPLMLIVVVSLPSAKTSFSLILTLLDCCTVPAT